MKQSEFIRLDGVDIVSLIQQKKVMAEEVLEASFKQLGIVNGELNATTHLREKDVYKDAQEVTMEGALAGLPIFLKDISQSLKGSPLTGGSRLLQNMITPTNSNFVQRIVDAGCLPMGHTTTPEFALKNITEPEVHGQTKNPWNLDFSPGGSSGGSAALVASGVMPIAGASDGGGSIRIPASFSSLFGLKPTRGRTPVGPGVGRNWHGAAIEFVLTRSVLDSARMLDVLQIVQQEAAFQTPLFLGSYEKHIEKPFDRPLNIGFSMESPVFTPVSNDAKKATKKVLHWLEEQGHYVEEVDNDIDGEQLMRNYFLMNSGEMATLVENLESSLQRKVTADDMEIESWVLNVAGKNVFATEFSKSIASWDLAAEKMANFHQAYDFYITPATAFTAPEIGELTPSLSNANELREQIELLESDQQQALIYEMFLPGLTYTPFTQLANLTGQPAMSVPVHLTDLGLPLGVQVIAPKGDEHKLLQLANQLEQSHLWIGMKGNPYYK